MPKRQRDYAKERAQRDAKAKREGYKSYNQKETARRKTVARSEGYPSWRAKRKTEWSTFVNNIPDKGTPAFDKFIRDNENEKNITKLVNDLIHALERGGNDMRNMPDINDPRFWDWFRVWYSSSNSA